METLTLDNILESEAIDSLFDDEINEEETIIEDSEEQDNKDKDNKTTEISNVDELFTDESESVGSGSDDIKDKENTNSDKESGSSPKNNFYSSIAKTLKEEGVFPDLKDDITNNIKTPEDLLKVVEEQIQSKFDERTKRIDEALNYDIEPSEIKKYENTLNYLENIKEEQLTDESDKGETLRKQLIYQDFINRGYSKERAQREVQKSFNSGTDIEDAKEALNSNKEYFSSEYNDLIEEAKENRERENRQREEEAASLKKSILEDDKIFNELQLDKKTRQKVYDTISKPVYKDPKTGQLFTTIQKYEMDNKTDFLKNLGLFYTLTNGFKDFDGLIKNKVKKEVGKSLRELENTINNTSRNFDGSLKFISGISDDKDSIISKGWNIDV